MTPGFARSAAPYLLSTPAGPVGNARSHRLGVPGATPTRSDIHWGVVGSARPSRTRRAIQTACGPKGWGDTPGRRPRSPRRGTPPRQPPAAPAPTPEVRPARTTTSRSGLRSVASWSPPNHGPRGSKLEILSDLLLSPPRDLQPVPPNEPHDVAATPTAVPAGGDLGWRQDPLVGPMTDRPGVDVCQRADLSGGQQPAA